MLALLAVFFVGLLAGLLVASCAASRRAMWRKTAAATSRLASACFSAEDLKMMLLVRTDLGMQKGKIAAQCGHAVLGSYKVALQQQSSHVDAWESAGEKKIAVKVTSEEELRDFYRRASAAGIPCYMVRDAGHTQVAPHTRTVCALGPALEEALQELGCNGLKLL